MKHLKSYENKDATNEVIENLKDYFTELSDTLKIPIKYTFQCFGNSDGIIIEITYNHSLEENVRVLNLVNNISNRFKLNLVISTIEVKDPYAILINRSTINTTKFLYYID